MIKNSNAKHPKTIRKQIEMVKKFREAQQQYSTPAKEQNFIPNNAEGSIGDTVIVNQEGGKSLYIKSFNGWFRTELAQNIGTTSAGRTTTAATSDTEVGPPDGNLTATRTGNQFITLTWTYGSNAHSHQLYRSSSDGSSFIEPGTLIQNGTSSGSFQDNLTSLAVGTWYYKIIFYNIDSVPFTIQDQFATTIDAYQLRDLQHLTEQTGPSTSVSYPYTNTELLECAEFGDTTSADNATATGYYTDDINFAVNSKIYDSAQGSAVDFYGTGGDFNGNQDGSGGGTLPDSYVNGWFGQDNPVSSDNDVIINVDDDGDVIAKYSAVPNVPSITLSATTSSAVTVNLSGEAYVTRHWKVQIDTVNTFDSSNLQTAYVTPSVKGTTASGNATGSNTFSSGITAGTTYYVRARAQNGTNTGSPLHTSSYSATSNVTTAAAGTAWSNVPADFTLTAIGFNGIEYSSGKTITLTNGSGNTTIQCSQTGLNGVLSVAASTSSTPSTSDTYTTSVTISNAGTYYLRFKYARVKSINDNSAQTVTFTNNSVSNTDLDITCVGTDLAP